MLLSPAVPMLFMGEEHGAAAPFLYFCDFDAALGRAVAAGRRREFARFAAFADPAVRARIPDPNDAATFDRSKLRWAERDEPEHRAWLDFYRELLALRRQHLVPWLPQARSGVCADEPDRPLHIRWPLGARRTWHLLVHLTDRAAAQPAIVAGKVIYDSAPGSDGWPPWSVRVVFEDA